jgi:hypothetical protein
LNGIHLGAASAYHPVMEKTQSTPTDPVALVRQLDPAAIRARLEDLSRERAALLVLLRAAQRAHPDRPARQATKVADA